MKSIQPVKNNFLEKVVNKLLYKILKSDILKAEKGIRNFIFLNFLKRGVIKNYVGRGSYRTSFLG